MTKYVGRPQGLVSKVLPAALSAAITVVTAVCAPHSAWAAPARAYDPFDDSRAVFPDDADTLGLEDSIAQGAQDDAAQKPLKLMPMGMLLFNGPLDGGAPTLSGMLQLDTVLRRGSFGVQITPRLRLADLVGAPLGKSEALLQQAFVFFRAGGGEVKLGKVLAQFGRFWDYGVHGPLLGNAEAKILPEVGMSFELTLPIRRAFELEVVGQYFAVDGRTFSVHNDSLLSTRGARRKNIAGLRVVPVLRQGEHRLSLGLSGQHFTAQRPQPHQVYRFAADFSYDHPWAGAFVEVGNQRGLTINSDNETIASFSYVWAGIEARLPPLSLRYHINVMRYVQPYPGVDVLHQPGIEWTATPMLSLVLEGAVWRSSQNVLPRGEQSILLVAFFKI